MSGGIAVLYQLAARLRELGREVVLAGVNDAPGLAAQTAAGFSVTSWDDVMGKNGAPFLREGDLFLISEGWPNMMAPALAARARVVAYAQSWIYINTALPEGAAWKRLPVSFLAVSHPVARFLEDMAHIPSRGVIRPVIDPARFRPRAQTGGKTVRIAWMSRKNKALAEQIMQITGGMDQSGMDQAGSPSNRLTGRSRSGSRPSRVEWVEIRNMTPDEVAETLASCHIFLSTGFPEGCPLPPLEAMASGCLVVGFTGYGGWDYMRQATPGQYAPRIALRPVPWGGNGFFAPDGDVLEASYLLHAAINMVRENAPEYAAIREQAILTATAYSVDGQRNDVRTAWDMLENSPHG